MIQNNKLLLQNDKLLVQFDKDAKAIIKTIYDVDGIMINETERWYVNHIVSGLKAIGVWNKIKALYGFVGGTAETHRWNWKDMRDADDAFRLTWPETVIHTDLGIKKNGSTGYAETFFNPKNELSENYASFSVYVTEKPFIIGTDPTIGCGDGVNNRYMFIYDSYNIVETLVSVSIGNSYSNKGILTGNTGFSLSKINYGNNNLFYNGQLIPYFANFTSPQYPDYTITILAVNNLGSGRSFNTIGFSHIGEGLTDSESKQMSHIVTTAQGILSRK